MEAATLGAILAPTDAALGQAVVSSPLVRLWMRQALDVESGLYAALRARTPARAGQRSSMAMRSPPRARWAIRRKSVSVRIPRSLPSGSTTGRAPTFRSSISADAS